MKYYVIYPYSSYEMGIPEMEADETYPREYMRICKYETKQAQLDAFANTMCEASRCFDGESDADAAAFANEYITKLNTGKVELD